MRLPTTIIAAAVAVLLAAAAVAKDEAGPGVGDDAPAFSGKTDSGETWNSADHYDDKVVVAFFYPAALTGG